MAPELCQSQCENCCEVWPDDGLDPIENLHERVAPGERMPSGECPDCGCLCHPIPEPIEVPSVVQ